MMLLRSLLSGLILLSAAHLSAAAPTLSSGPPVTDGDLGCIIATGAMDMAYTRMSEDPTRTSAERDEYKAKEALSFNTMNFYTGRVSALPANRRDKPAYDAALANYAKLDGEGRFKMYRDCARWAGEANGVVVGPWLNN